jgi:hypothetical protein
VLFFIHLESRRVSLVGLAKHPKFEWMLYVARNVPDERSGSSMARANAEPPVEAALCRNAGAADPRGGSCCDVSLRYALKRSAYGLAGIRSGRCHSNWKRTGKRGHFK